MKVQFRCCLCGQVNVYNLTAADEVAPPSGVISRILGLFGSKSKGAPRRYTVQCEFCSQNNKISPPPSRSAPRA